MCATCACSCPRSAGPPAGQTLPDGFSYREMDVGELEPFIGVPESNVERKDLERARVRGVIAASGYLRERSWRATASTRRLPHGSTRPSVSNSRRAGSTTTWRSPSRRGAGGACTASRLPPSSEGLPGGRPFRGIVTLVSSVNYASRASLPHWFSEVEKLHRSRISTKAGSHLGSRRRPFRAGQACVMSDEVVDARRRRLLRQATTAAGTLALAGAAHPFIASLAPSERTRAQGGPVES